MREDALTHRQLEILALIMAGGSDRHIAAQLGISPGTVSNHVATILQKLHAQNRAHAAFIGARTGLAPPRAGLSRDDM